MKKYYLLLLLIIISANLSVAQKYSELNSLIKKYSSSKLFKNGQWGLYARYLDRGEEIISLNEKMSLAPASNLKLFTSAAAFEYLGKEYSFETKFYYSGKIDKTGILNGDIYIKGGGDPTLGYDLVKTSLSLDPLMNKIIKEVKNLGITRINGNIIADDLLYSGTPIPKNWQWLDIGNYYGTSISALTIHNNLYFLYFNPGKKVGDLAVILRTEPEIPGLTFTNFMKTGKKGSGDNGYIFAAPLQYNATLRGRIPQGGNEFSIKGSIPDPALFTSQYLRKKIIYSGIIVSGTSKKLQNKISYNSLKIITTVKSAPLKEIIKIVNKRSDNLYTELLLKAIALQKTGEGSTEKGVKSVKEFLKNNNIKVDGLLLYDGSGLSRTNAITAQMMVDMLEVVTKKEYFKSFYNSLSLMGDPNDISSFRNIGIGTVLEKNVRIKSGSLEGVRAYSGYLKDRNKRTIIFSFIANNFNGTGGSVNKIHRKLLIELAKIYREISK